MNKLITYFLVIIKIKYNKLYKQVIKIKNNLILQADNKK